MSKAMMTPGSAEEKKLAKEFEQATMVQDDFESQAARLQARIARMESKMTSKMAKVQDWLEEITARAEALGFWLPREPQWRARWPR